ncbi:hypothetical protein AQUCO_00600190v1 [Aquilegia coerulea]|uniref:Uncharacterized protein n=1 Tax=Aquilegia coerulea TaxID=218851 RepID=A0A2G5ENC5_AQUCA|nr:hypothetical protein AQUCO_00600190v1 [Aquilegia coerulea]
MKGGYMMNTTEPLVLGLKIINMDQERENGSSSDSESEREQPQIPTKKDVRGTTKMNSLVKNWDGNLIHVQYDEKRRPIPHEVRKKVAGYEGALARQLVPLNACENWRHLSDEIQDKLWEAMTQLRASKLESS